MFVASLKNDNKDEINYIYLEKGKYIGFSVNENGLGNFDYNLFNQFINGIKFNNKCIKVAKYEDYDVYFNPTTKYNHYLKDGKEDLVMFYLKNGTDALLYSKKDEFNHYFVLKKIVIGASVVLAAATLYMLIEHFVNFGLLNFKDYIMDDSSFEYVLNYDNISVEDYIEKIYNSSKLEDTEKEILSNEQLLIDLKPYYENSYMKHLINFKLHNIDIDYFERKGSNENILGYYSSLNFNQIYLSDEYKKEELINDSKNKKYATLVHEYIHLLQANGRYNYIDEAVADIMAEEYYDVFDSAYYNADKNIKFLIETVGPEPILEYSFGGNTMNLENILADNLSFEFYKELLEYFSKKPSELSLEEHYRINMILIKLYQQINQKKIQDDNELLFEYLYSYSTNAISSRKYLNKSKVLEEDKIVITYSQKDIDNLLKYDLLNYIEKKLIKREVDLNEYINNEKVDIEYICSDIKKIGNKLYYKDVYIELSEAYKNGYIKFYEFDKISKTEEIPEGWLFEKDLAYYVSNNKDLQFLDEENGSFTFIYFGKGLSTKFDIKYNDEKNKNIHM